MHFWYWGNQQLTLRKKSLLSSSGSEVVCWRVPSSFWSRSGQTTPSTVANSVALAPKKLWMTTGSTFSCSQAAHWQRSASIISWRKCRWAARNAGYRCFLLLLMKTTIFLMMMMMVMRDESDNFDDVTVMMQQLQPFRVCFQRFDKASLQFSSSRLSFTSAQKCRRYSMRMILQFRVLRFAWVRYARTTSLALFAASSIVVKFLAVYAFPLGGIYYTAMTLGIVSESNFGPAKRIKKGMEWNSHIMSKWQRINTGLTPLAWRNVHATCTVMQCAQNHWERVLSLVSCGLPVV